MNKKKDNYPQFPPTTPEIERIIDKMDSQIDLTDREITTFNKWERDNGGFGGFIKNTDNE